MTCAGTQFARPTHQNYRHGPTVAKHHFRAFCGSSSQYRQRYEHMFEHRVGIRNPRRNVTATGVQLQWTGMSPCPDIDLGYPPVFPQRVPMLTGGDPNIGISIPAGQLELWVIVSTATDSDGVMTAGVFGREHGKFQGTPWRFEPDDRWRLNYRIVADNLPE